MPCTQRHDASQRRDDCRGAAEDQEPHLHVARAGVPDGPYVEQAVQAELHALVLKQLDVRVGARQVDDDLALLLPALDAGAAAVT